MKSTHASSIGLPTLQPPNRLASTLLVFLLAGPAFAYALAGDASSRPSLADELISRTRKLERVTGSAVYDGGEPGPFYLLSKEIRSVGDTKIYERLISDSNPIVRAMGLYCLAQTDRTAALPALRAKLLSRECYDCFPGGCVGSRITEGDFAWQLVCDTGYLEMRPKPTPLLSDSERLAMNLWLMSADQACTYHHEIAGELDTSQFAPTGKLTLTELQRAAPGRSPANLIKAISRLKRSEQIDDFLQACVSNNKLSPDARFAAASAISISASLNAIQTIQLARSELNALDPSQLGDRFVQTAEQFALFESAIRPIREAKTTEAMKKLRAEARIVFRTNELFAFDDLIDAILRASIKDDLALAQIVADSLAQLADRLTEAEPPWNIQRDLIYRYDDFLRREEDPDFSRDVRLIKRVLGPTRWAKLKQTVRNAVKTAEAHDAKQNAAGAD